MTIEEQLDLYAEYVERQETLQKQMQELIDKVLVPQKVLNQWNEIKAEFQPLINIASTSANELKISIEANVLTIGSTAKGSHYMAVWNKGRETWDGKKLDGYAMDHPEILQAKKVGEP